MNFFLKTKCYSLSKWKKTNKAEKWREIKEVEKALFQNSIFFFMDLQINLFDILVDVFYGIIGISNFFNCYKMRFLGLVWNLAHVLILNAMSRRLVVRYKRLFIMLLKNFFSTFLPDVSSIYPLTPILFSMWLIRLSIYNNNVNKTSIKMYAWQKELK